MANFRFPSGPAWKFRAGRFTVKFYVERERGYKYDGDDEDGETQAKLDSGEYVAFTSRAVVELDGEEIGTDYLGGSVYAADDVPDFWTAHRTSPAESRNTLANAAKRVCICHYFPDMIREAISEARCHVRGLPSVPYIREGAN